MGAFCAADLSFPPGPGHRVGFLPSGFPWSKRFPSIGGVTDSSVSPVAGEGGEGRSQELVGPELGLSPKGGGEPLTGDLRWGGGG